MSELSQPAFDRVGEEFRDHYNTLRGYVRQEVTRRNLKPYAQPGMLAIDVGGGDGCDSEWLATQGIIPTLVDSSRKMLDASESRKDIAQRILGDVHSLGGEYYSFFDLVVSHGVLMYDLENPQGHLDRLVKLAKPGGVISLLTKGYLGAKLRLVEKGSWEGVTHLKDTGQVARNNLGETTWAHTSEKLTEMIDKAGARVVQWSGVRILTDEMYEPIDTIHQRELTHWVDAEHSIGNDAEFREQGQMLHFIARRAD